MKVDNIYWKNPSHVDIFDIILLRKKILEGKADLQKHEEKKEKVFMEGEKELWETGDWRDHVKDLNGSFSKLPPINRGKKIAGKGQAFVVE